MRVWKRKALQVLRRSRGRKNYGRRLKLRITHRLSEDLRSAALSIHERGDKLLVLMS